MSTMTLGSALSQAGDICGAFDAIEWCDGCRNHLVTLKHAMRDARAVASKRAQGVGTSHTWEELTERAAADLATNVTTALAHLDLPHNERQAREPREAAPAKFDERPTCPDCGTHVNVTGNRINAHRAASGNPCRRRFMEAPDLPVPPVHLPPPTRVVNPQRAAEPAAPHLSRLDAGSACRDCGKWLPGERQVCGACFASTHR